MKVKVSSLGIIGAIFGFISVLTPWLLVTVNTNIPLIGIISITLSLKPYQILIITMFEDLIIGQALMIFGSILALIFLNKIEADRNQKYYDKIPLLGLIGGVLNGLAILTFFLVLINEGSGYDMTPDSVSVEFGLISSIISVVLIILAFLAARGNSKHLKITLITIESMGSRDKPN
jgi:hypothetical protein